MASRWSSWSRFTQGLRRRPITSFSFATGSLAASIVTQINSSAAGMAEKEVKTQPMTQNRILSDKHRVALAGWPVHESLSGAHQNDNRRNSIESLIEYIQQAGYDGMEITFEMIKAMYYTDTTLDDAQIAQDIKQKLDAADLQCFGILLHSQWNDWEPENVDAYLQNLRLCLRSNRLIGAEYVTFQIWLPPQYLRGDGSYRNNEELLNEYVRRIRVLQELCFEHGLNFYVETHVGRLSEDPEAFSKIIDYAGDFEVNGDLSHYLCRGMMKGPFVEKILGKMQHTHVRMARIYGDLSVDVEDPEKDWNESGVTKDYWTFTKNGFKNGLSSRVIVGESGPIHLVKDALEQDKKMVPLLRAMANYCDLQVQQTKYDTEMANPFQAQQ